MHHRGKQLYKVFHEMSRKMSLKSKFDHRLEHCHVKKV